MKSIDLASIDLNLLVVFEAIFETQGVTAAAQALHLGQPAVSAALGRLRVLFADELFIRIGREMKPTAKALRLAPEIAAALQQIRQTLAASQTFDPTQSQRAFVIGISDYASAVILPKLLKHCQQAAPGLDFRLKSFDKDQVEVMLEQQEIAVAIGTFQTVPRQVLQCPLMQETFVGICRKNHPAIASPNPLSVEEFANFSHALFTLRQDAIGELDRVLTRHQHQRRIVLTTPYLLVIPAMVAASDLVAAVPSRLAQQFAAQGMVETFELPVTVAPWMISMIWSKLTEQDPAHQWLRQTLQTICQVI